MYMLVRYDTVFSKQRSKIELLANDSGHRNVIVRTPLHKGGGGGGRGSTFSILMEMEGGSENFC